jgi:DNA-binding response OmpR family regulator
MPLILYTEDDAILQAEGDMFLADAGYEVMTASTGAEACALLREHGPRVSALITDINLSDGPDGWRVAEVGREIRGSLPVLYVSASDGDAFRARGVRNSIWSPKPFEWPRLLRTVSHMLAH